MPNSYFRFKQFIIQQDRCAMKVCTDSCILGAWSSIRVREARNILDIGTGTGLLPLMLAQRSAALIDAIESDPESYAQAKENILQSNWSPRIRVLEGDARNYAFPDKYDFIISNPPFYESDLRSPEPKKNKAKHDESLTLGELKLVVRSRLQPQGAFCILLPFLRTNYFENLASGQGLFLQEKLIIRQSPKHVPFRSIGLYSLKNPGSAVSDELIIKDIHGQYSPEFVTLMNDYYSQPFAESENSAKK